jgi:hypothetical protein
LRLRAELRVPRLSFKKFEVCVLIRSCVSIKVGDYALFLLRKREGSSEPMYVAFHVRVSSICPRHALQDGLAPNRMLVNSTGSAAFATKFDAFSFVC